MVDTNWSGYVALTGIVGDLHLWAGRVMNYHKPPKTIESKYKTMSQEVLRRYHGEIDCFVVNVSELESRSGLERVAARLSDAIKLDVFRKGSYVGLNSIVWKIVAVDIVSILTDPPIPAVILKLERIDHAPTQTP